MDPEQILKLLSTRDLLDSLGIAQELSEDHQKVVGAIKSLQSLGDVIKADEVTLQQWQLTDEGREVIEKGSHEARVFDAISGDGIEQAKIGNLFPNAKIGLSKALAAGWLQIDKKSGAPKVIRKVTSVEDAVKDSLSKISGNDVSNGVSDKVRQELKKRKLVQEVTTKSYRITKGPQFATSISKQEVELTKEMIASGSWKEKSFKPYNFDALGTPATRGHLHPLMKVRAEFRQIFLEMGFTEMPTNNYIESSFWNFDALFQPQQHPARDAHDTFFITDPPQAKHLPSEYMQRVKTIHQSGGHGSIGYRYDWKESEARKNLLRTHTTANSARMLYQLAQKVPFAPVKYFSIDRVFRNETLDATHLAEFCQIEGVIADRHLTLGDLIGVLYQFFNKLGIKELKFKPAYNPYTEPSMEIFSFHQGLNKWVEIGNSGMFRPEMLLPMNLPEDVRVIAWGLSLERPTMIKYGIDNIRDLVGPKVNLQMVHDNPICRLDKTESSASETSQARTNASSLHGVDVVIMANPSGDHSALSTLLSLTGSDVTTHIHSSLLNTTNMRLPRIGGIKPGGPKIRWIWTCTVSGVRLHVLPNRTPIDGAANVLRYVARVTGSSLHPADPVRATLMDGWLDLVAEGRTSRLEGATIRHLESGEDWLAGPSPSLADLAVAPLVRVGAKSTAVKRWLDRCGRAFA